MSTLLTLSKEPFISSLTNPISCLSFLFSMCSWCIYYFQFIPPIQPFIIVRMLVWDYDAPPDYSLFLTWKFAIETNNWSSPATWSDYVSMCHDHVGCSRATWDSTIMIIKQSRQSWSQGKKSWSVSGQNISHDKSKSLKTNHPHFLVGQATKLCGSIRALPKHNIMRRRSSRYLWHSIRTGIQWTEVTCGGEVACNVWFISCEYLLFKNH